MADVTDTQIDTEFSGGSTPTEPTLFDAADIFDQAAVHHFGNKPPIVGTEEIPGATESADDDTGNQLSGEDTEETVNDGDNTQNTEATESEFKPYSFKGRVFGEEVETKFESPEDLNKIISRGLASETLYKKMKEKDTVIQSLNADAESGREFESLARENPEALLDLVIEKYMDDERAATKVLKLFEHYREQARMTPEQREHARKLKVADQLIREKEAAQAAAKEAETKQTELRVQQQKVEDRNWANFELKRLTNRFQNLDADLVKQQILNVMTQVRLSRQQGNEMTHQQATQLLARYMKPFEKLTSPAETKRRLGDAINQKKQQSADTIGNAARQQIQRQAPVRGEASGPIDPVDAFDIIKQRVASGQYKLRP